MTNYVISVTKHHAGGRLRVLEFHGTVTSLPTARPSCPISGGVRRETEGRVLRGIGVHAGVGFGGGEINVGQVSSLYRSQTSFRVHIAQMIWGPCRCCAWWR